MLDLPGIFLAKTQEEYLHELLFRLEANGVPWRSWLSPANLGLSLTQALSEFLAELRARVQAVAASQFLDFAEGEGLRLFAQSRFRVEAQKPQPTVGKFLLSSTFSAPHYSFAPGQLRVGQPGPEGVVFSNLDGGSLPPGGTLSLTFQADQPGIAGNLPNFSLLELKTAFAGVSVSNPPLAGGSWILSHGADIEDDARLRARCEARWSTLGVGASAEALKFWALAVPLGRTRSPVERVRVYSNRAGNSVLGGCVTVLVAGPAGALSPEDLAAVAQNFEGATADFPEANFPKYQLGCALFVQTTANRIVPVVGTLYARRQAGLSPEEVRARAEDALARFQSELEIGDSLFPQKLAAVLTEGPGEGVVRNAVLSSPAGTIALAFNETAVFDTAGLSVELVP